jgi:hypothetical protein
MKMNIFNSLVLAFVISITSSAGGQTTMNELAGTRHRIPEAHCSRMRHDISRGTMIDDLCETLQYFYRLMDGEIVMKQQGYRRGSQNAIWGMSEKSVEKGLAMKKMWVFSVIALSAYWATTMPAYSTNPFDRGRDRDSSIFDHAHPVTNRRIPERAKFAGDCMGIFSSPPSVQKKVGQS